MGLHTVAGGPVPATLNWAKRGKMNPVKDQGPCGSCWAFAAADALSSRNAVKNGILWDVSEKHMLDCTYWEGRDGCLGGNPINAWENVGRVGVASNRKYPAYNARDDTCPNNDQFTPTSYNRVVFSGSSGTDAVVHQYFSNTHELKQDINKYGPCVMLMGADAAFMSLRGTGIWSCNPTVGLNHAITVVGWGVDNGHHYWMIKNSWDTGWGDNGYGRVSMRDCAIGSFYGVVFQCPEVRSSTERYALLGQPRYVARNEGNIVQLNGADGQPWMSLDQCKAACDSNPSCKSFAHCPRHANFCWLKERVLTDAEPTNYSYYCETYYQYDQKQPAVGNYAMLGPAQYVAQDEGNPVGFVGRAHMSLDECKRACDEETECNSFAHCPNHVNYCWLKDKVFSGGEPVQYKYYCETYYRTGDRRREEVMDRLSFSESEADSDNETVGLALPAPEPQDLEA